MHRSEEMQDTPIQRERITLDDPGGEHHSGVPLPMDGGGSGWLSY